ncbi:acyl-CoA dehydrogenase domain-containing protein [Nocardia nova SH22a]|uniref:Acyl-CoA dehydrogenase domain-containing protein n=1 Tax=Nocardia nova SH22a TaxID=1415166 RepID=W5TJE8_9NOCA|nr:acyl-CoA dehydrogenase family protein [Nocardia nova]AHH19103.1 acyl-CoA dehydrogenase domain-containing protein [Nocardia nova SH22a]
MDSAELDLLIGTLRATMIERTGAELDRALLEFGWLELLTESPDIAIPLVFRLLGETGAHASVLNDVVGHAADRELPAQVALPFTGGRWVSWDRATGPAGQGCADGGAGLHAAHSSGDKARSGESARSAGVDTTGDSALDPELPLRSLISGETLPLAEGRRALAWWLIGTSRTMLALARRHALDRIQFGRPLAAHQAVRHRLAETLVAIEGAEATLTTADDDLGALLAKAAAGQAARTAARHCQQVLGGIGFTAEHEFHRHVRRALVLDGLLGSTTDLTREAGAWVRTRATAPRLAQL